MNPTNTCSRLAAILIICAAVLTFTACPKSNTSTPPTPAPITVSNAIKTLADAGAGAAHSAIVCRDSGGCSPQDAAKIEAVVTVAENAVLQMNVVLRSPDPWDVQRGKLLQILQSIGLSTLQANVSANTYAVATAMLTAANTLSTILGGPQI